MKKSYFHSAMVVALIFVTAATITMTGVTDYNIGTGYLARVSPVIAEGNVVAVTSAGLLYDSGVSAYSIGTSAIKDTQRSAGWTDTLGGASLHALEHAFAEYADIKITGPSSCVDNQIVRYDGATGKIGQASYAYVDDNGSVNIPTGQTYQINSTSVILNSNRSAGWTATTSSASMAAIEQAFAQYSDVKTTGPASAVDNQIARFDLTTGKIIQTSAAYVDDSGNFSTTAKATVGKLVTTQIAYDMSAGVTATAIETAVGANAAACGAGYQVSIVSLATACYKCETNGTGWWFEELEVAP